MTLLAKDFLTFELANLGSSAFSNKAPAVAESSLWSSSWYSRTLKLTPQNGACQLKVNAATQRHCLGKMKQLNSRFSEPLAILRHPMFHASYPCRIDTESVWISILFAGMFVCLVSVWLLFCVPPHNLRHLFKVFCSPFRVVIIWGNSIIMACFNNCWTVEHEKETIECSWLQGWNKEKKNVCMKIE